MACSFPTLWRFFVVNFQRERVMIDPEINYQEEEIKVKGLSYSSGYSLLLNSLDGKKLQASLRM